MWKELKRQVSEKSKANKLRIEYLATMIMVQN